MRVPATNAATMQKVLITQRFFDDQAIALLRAHGCEPVIAELPPGEADGNVPPSTLLQWLHGASGWIVGHARVTRALLAELPQLQVVARRGVGYERLDTMAVHELGRVATIAAGANDPTVADLTIGLMLAVGRRLAEGSSNVRRGTMSIALGTDLYHKTVGIVGFGRIGQAVAKRLRGFECRILVHSPSQDADLARAHDIEYTDLRTLLSTSDYVSLHAPLNGGTSHLLCDETLAMMKPSAYLINTARGGLIEDRHLLKALRSGTIAGAGLDVFMSESDPGYCDVTRELASLPNVVTVPHIGASTREGLARSNMVAARCVLSVLAGQPMPDGCVVADGRAVSRR
jgi:D-3-phosphoglycerate dehydrogenase